MLRPNERQKTWLGTLAEKYNETLTPEVTSYLERRGIDLTVASGNLLGLVVEPDPSHVQYTGRLSIPYITPTGVVTMRFRCLEHHVDMKCEGHGKYESPSGEETRLYNVNALHEDTDIIGICEGELDALVATAAGLPSVGMPGINNWKPYYYRLFEDYEKVILLGDGDTAGRSMVATLAHNMRNGVRRPLPEGYDVSSYVTEYKADEFLSYALD